MCPNICLLYTSNLIDGVEHLFFSPSKSDKPYYTIFGIPYAQYFRTDLSVSRKIMLGGVTALVEMCIRDSGQHRDKQIPCGSAQDTHALEACFYASFLVHVGTFDLIDGFFVCCVPEPGVENGVRRGAGKAESVVFHRLFLLGYGFEIGFAGHGGASVPGGGTDAQGARRTGAGVRSDVYKRQM